MIGINGNKAVDCVLGVNINALMYLFGSARESVRARDVSA